jgi:glucokinase
MEDGVSVTGKSPLKSNLMASSTTYSVGIDLGGSSLKAVAAADRETLERINLEFDPERELDWLQKARNILDQFHSRLGKPEQIGVSAPGLAALDGTSILCMPGRLSGLEKLNWAQALSYSKSIPVLNDAHAAILGEAWCGAADGFRNVFMLTLGTGVGGAAIVDGKLLRGAFGRGGHLGHASLDIDGPIDVAGMPGSLEGAIGNCTIGERSNGRFATTHDLITAFDRHDPYASEVWLRSIKVLACAIASFVNVLDPEAVIIGGGIARAGESLFGPLQKYLDEVEWRPLGVGVKILPAKLGEFAGAYGAAWAAGAVQSV